MNRVKKVFSVVFPVMMLVMLMFVSFVPNVFADTKDDIDNIMAGKDTNGKQLSTGSVTDVDKAVGSIWSTVLTILQILAVAAIVIAGVRYMFASADQKADIKKGMIGLVIGAILVFAASTVVQFIISATTSVI
mgnify:CR=1 FL=1